MSDYDYERLSLADAVSALKGEDSDTFRDLLVKAFDVIMGREAGVIGSLRDDLDDARDENRMLRSRCDEIGRHLAAAKATIEARDQRIADLLNYTHATDLERGRELTTENDRLKRTVETQRLIIARHERANGRSFSSPLDWAVGTALARFINPLTARA